jgi:outer membrane protein OmpA-like peptidoglycan-associated protein
MERLSAGLCALGVFVGAASPALAAEPWLLQLELPGAMPLGSPQRDWFGPGLMPAAGLYHGLVPQLVAGVRLRGGALVSGSVPDDPGLRDPSLGGLGTFSLALRVRPLACSGGVSRARGPWLEVAGGPGLTGKLLRATAEIGAGWSFRAGRVLVGPSVRYVHVVQPDHDSLDGRDARLALLGFEVTLFDPTPPAPFAFILPKPSVAPPLPGDSDGDGIADPDDRCPKEPEDLDGFEDGDGCPDLDNDHDGIVDSLDKCPSAAEVVNGVDDGDGCPDEGVIELINDRIVLEDRVLFDVERARVKTAARQVLGAIVTLWKQHPEWDRMTVEGHTDVRGPDKYNEWLSGERADRVKAVLVELGIPADRLDTKGYGRSRPLEKAAGPDGHQRNRRVEFVIVTKKNAPTGMKISP